jgi:hypothetical protein
VDRRGLLTADLRKARATGRSAARLLRPAKRQRSGLGERMRHVTACGRSRQHRTLPQHDPSGSESGGRGGVSELGGGGQLTAEASAASTSGSPSARTRNVALCARRPRDARWNKSD